MLIFLQIIFHMSNKQNVMINQVNEAAKSHFRRSRVFPPRNKFSEACHSPSKQYFSKPQIRALIDIVPQDQAFIEDYIEELKSKLIQMKLSPNKKKNSPLQNNQEQQHRYQNTKQKSTAKIIKNSNQIHVTNRSTEFSRKNMNDHRLLNLNSVRDEVKRLKSNVERRVVTEKQNRRYEQQEYNKYEGNQFNSQRSNYKMRSNTEQVIRSSKNPVRIYRYSSERKAKLGEEKYRSNLTGNKNSNQNQKMNKYQQSQSRSASKQINSPKQENIKRRVGLQRQRQINKGQLKPDRIRLQKDKQVSQKIQDLSTIMAKKQTLNFLGDSCVAIKQQLENYKKGTAKFLDFLDWKTKQLKDVYLNCKQKKRRWELDKLSKIFPKGFFI